MKKTLFGVLSIVFSSVTLVQLNADFENYVLVIDCNPEQAVDEFSDLRTFIPKIIVICHPGNWKNWEYFDNIQDRRQIRYNIRYGSQRFTHIFHNIETEEIINAWQELYLKLTITKFTEDFFLSVTREYHKYAHFDDPGIFRTDYLRSQWNQDKFIINESSDREIVVKSLSDYADQLPTLFQKENWKPPSVHEFGVIFYSPLSGWGGSRCEFYDKWEQIWELTNSFNAFNMLFCEVFRYHNLTLIPHYNFEEFAYIRHFLLRDDLISSFPPDSNALFYESPGITFVILKEPALIWGNVLRPFDLHIWFGIIASCFSVVIFSLIFAIFDAQVQLQRESRMADFETLGINLIFRKNIFLVHKSDFNRLWHIFVRLFMFFIMAAYSGMVLAGLLYPFYPWTPTNFAELNKTTNYIAAIAYDIEVNHELLKKSFMLNGIKNNNWIIPNVSTPENERIYNPGGFLPFDEEDKENRYALLMYSDKRLHYISARSQLYATFKYIQRLKADNEVVLSEMRYISVKPGSTKLHFLIESIRRNFECGIWLRWKHLENNYFRFIAPIVVSKYYGGTQEALLRSINLNDMMTTLSILGLGLSTSALFYLLENLISKLLLIKCLLCHSW